jgi:hypothetical protein
LAVANRCRRPRLRFTTIDRALWASLSQRWHGWNAPPRRAAGDGTWLASARLSPALDVEESTSHGAAGGASRRPRVDSRNVHGQSALGRPSNPLRAPEVGNLGESVDRCQIHAAAAAAAVANVADLPH